ncbi:MULTISPECIES: toxin-antitoxin system YwqK family antitoxin [Flavobacterium]|jgi:antitoxin component YwqK of YwqJK toxin-antitoxin module|uniref:Toxin-antitoxin system YwqK family antitoxin n=1 Tax=Flavobacterium jumunjinense TaxID=998845 RepID=A0ABV5GUG1_9FLAO|nr:MULTISPECIES: hypothetical protein [Flavobacterium]
MNKFLFLFFFVVTMQFSFAQESYVKNRFANGKMKEEGWVINGKKAKYWFYYYENGNTKEEGHYSNGNKVNWWIYYDKKEEVIRKTEYKNNVQNGFSIIYRDGDVVKAEKYSVGKKIKEWHSMAEFREDNPSLF